MSKYLESPARVQAARTPDPGQAQGAGWESQGARLPGSPGTGTSSVDHERDASRKVIPGPGCRGQAAGSEAISRKTQGFTPVK